MVSQICVKSKHELYVWSVCVVIFTAEIGCSDKMYKVSSGGQECIAMNKKQITDNLKSESEKPFFLPQYSLTSVPIYICSCTEMVLFLFYLELDHHLSHTPCFCC